MYEPRNICVYCGSSMGMAAVYHQGAVALGQALAERDIGLVYGGGSIGLMGLLADTVLEAGGRVFGVIPETLNRDGVKHENLTRLHVVTTIHERKALMAELSDAFVAMPGGYGTLEELLEAITWSQLGIHSKPVAVYNIAGYFDPLLAMIEHAISEGFIPPDYRRLLLTGTSPQAILEQFHAFVPGAYRPKWELVRGGDGARPSQAE